jgi:hypothetical protein
MLPGAARDLEHSAARRQYAPQHCKNRILVAIGRGTRERIRTKLLAVTLVRSSLGIVHETRSFEAKRYEYSKAIAPPSERIDARKVSTIPRRLRARADTFTRS